MPYRRLFRFFLRFFLRFSPFAFHSPLAICACIFFGNFATTRSYDFRSNRSTSARLSASSLSSDIHFARANGASRVDG
jgi:hypothetical protein